MLNYSVALKSKWFLSFLSNIDHKFLIGLMLFKSYNFWGKHQLMNDGDSISLQYHKVTVHDHNVPKFDIFETQTTAY